MPIVQALAVCGIVNPQAINAFNREEVHNVADFAQLTDKDIKDMAENMGKRPITQQGYKLGTVSIKRVRALALWARKRRMMQQPIPDDAFTAALLDAAMIELDLGDQEEMDIKKPPKLNPEEWDTWEPSFTNYLKSLKGVQGTPLSYVIRDPNLTVNDFDPTDDLNRLIYAVPLNGAAYNIDNTRVARELFSFISGTGADNFVDESSDNGRAMMTRLRAHYDGPGEVDKRYKKAQAVLESLHYKNEAVFTWSNFVSQLTKCFTTYEKAGRPLDPRTQMDYLIRKCLPTELAAVKEVARSTYPNDIHAAANYIGERISDIFSEAIAQRNRVRTQGRGRGRGYNRYVSGLGTQQGRGNPGRGFSRGGRGRGGRGGRGRGNRGGGRGYHPYNRSDRSTGSRNSQSTFNGVDVSDPTRRFTPNEFQRLGPEGRAYINTKRNEIHQQTNRFANLEQRLSAIETYHQPGGTVISEITTNTNPAPAPAPAAPGAGSTFGRGRHMARGRGRGRE